MSITATEMTFEQMVENFGYRVDSLLDGTRHYITKDERERAVVGPVRHKKTWRNKRNSKVAQTFERIATTDELSEQLAQASKMQELTFLKGLETIRLSEAFKGSGKPAKKEGVGRVRSAWNWAVERFWDEEYHKRCQQVLLTVMLTAFTAGSLVIIGKAVVWAVMN